ncbi:hypothetical protein chiPu_0026960, partial [Chiloscyllium punctatum]|nr:hypothetical protein [Chiloscyllium punctatum]
VRVYDPSSPQRRPVLEMTYEEYPLTAMSLTPDGNSVVVGNTHGQVAVLDIRKGEGVPLPFPHSRPRPRPIPAGLNLGLGTNQERGSSCNIASRLIVRTGGGHSAPIRQERKGHSAPLVPARQGQEKSQIILPSLLSHRNRRTSYSGLT